MQIAHYLLVTQEENLTEHQESLRALLPCTPSIMKCIRSYISINLCYASNEMMSFELLLFLLFYYYYYCYFNYCYYYCY